MFVEIQPNYPGSLAAQQAGFGLRTFAYMLDYVMTSNEESKTTAIEQGVTFFNEWSNANPGGWTRRETVGDFNNTATTNTTLSANINEWWAWSQPVIGKPDQAYFHKGFALRWNSSATSWGVPVNYFQGYMGAFQTPSDRTVFSSFDFARPLNYAFGTNISTATNFSTLIGPMNRSVYQDRYIMAAAEGYMFIGNIDQGTFWAVVDGTTLPIHEYPTSAAIPMLGLTGAGDSSAILTRHDLRVHVHKYDSGSGVTYNALSSFSQQINGDNSTAPSIQNFLNLYPSSASNQGFLDRFDVDGKRSTALYPIIIGNPIKGNAYQTTEGLLLLSGQGHVTGQTFYVGSARYYKFVCTHDRSNRSPEFSGLVLGVPIR